MAKKSYRDVFVFLSTASSYSEAHKDDQRKDDKTFNRALQRGVKRAAKFQEKYKEEVEDLDIKHCATDPPDDPQGVVKTDAKGNLAFTKDGLRARNKDRDELFERKDIDFEPVLSTVMPGHLTPAERRAFAGFILPEEVADIEDDEDEDKDDDEAPVPSAAAAASNSTAPEPGTEQ